MNVYCIQMTSGKSIEGNLSQAKRLIQTAVDRGADVIVTPENVDAMVDGPEPIRRAAYEETNHPSLIFFQELCVTLSKWILIGSLSVKSDEKIVKRSYLLDPSGRIAAFYDKIHMFDVTLSAYETYKESAVYHPGNAVAIGKTPWGTIGLTICYDLRFGALYRALGQAGVIMITVPAAFTKITGQAHWETLIRARAIENGCYIAAPAQCGVHENGRQTYGHSLIVDPWGEILAQGGDSPGIIGAAVERERVEETRARIPSLQHDRSFTLKQ